MTSPAQPGLGTATEILKGADIYVHYGLFDTLHAKNPAVKHWLVLSTTSSLGVNPSSFSLLGSLEVSELTGIRAVGTGTAHGVSITRYQGTLDLDKLAQLPTLKQLLSHLPSASAAVLSGSAELQLSVGSDGYIHGSSTTLDLHEGTSSLKIVVQAVLQDFNQESSPIMAPPASEVMTQQQFDQLAGIAPPAGATAVLQKVVLSAKQVGAGYTRTVIPGGHLVQGEATLDFCELKYPSESLRVARLQVAYTGKAKAISASNEVVAYAQGGAQTAMQEMGQAQARCTNGAVKSPPSGIASLVRHTAVVHDPRLPAGSVAILETDTGKTSQGKAFTASSLAVYQAHGEVLSGFYASEVGRASMVAFAAHAARVSAANLKRDVAGLPVA